MQREGGGRSGLEAAQTYCQKRLTLASSSDPSLHKYILYNTFTERAEYLYIKKMRIDVFEKAWQLLTESQSSASSGSALPEREQKTLESEAPTTCVQAEEPDLAKAEQKPKRTAASSPGGKPNKLPKVPETTADQKKSSPQGSPKRRKRRLTLSRCSQQRKRCFVPLMRRGLGSGRTAPRSDMAQHKPSESSNR